MLKTTFDRRRCRVCHMIRRAICFCAILICLEVHAESISLVTNESFETVGENNLPKDWRTITTWGTKGKFALDKSEKHTGQRSMRITSEANSQNYIASGPIPVSPGETFSCSAWVKTKDVKTGENGKVQIQGVLAREEGSDDGVTIAVVKLDPNGTSDWTHIEGDFKIPAQTTKAWV